MNVYLGENESTEIPAIFVHSEDAEKFRTSLEVLNNEVHSDTQNWYDDLKKAMETRGDDFSAKVCTLTDEQLKQTYPDTNFYSYCQAFTAWGENWVYFPVGYDGYVWVGAVPRNPCETATEPQGGGV